jgi:phosphoribosylformimino-5-aminoimidazole carboxamide ribotide isomerase
MASTRKSTPSRSSNASCRRGEAGVGDQRRGIASSCRNRVRIIGVVDLAGGLAVHARAGHRDRYAPVTTVAGVPIEPGDALALSRAYLDRFALGELYVADLDAITSAAPQAKLVEAIAGLGSPIWLDAGVTSGGQARQAASLGAAHIVVGLETLRSFDALGEICAEVGSTRVALSLDLRDGRPVSGFPTDASPEVIASRAVDAGAAAVIVIDLSRVGMSVGLDLDLIARIRAVVPGVTLLAGGGVRGVADLNNLADAGADGALVATALQDGRLSADDLRRAAARQPSAMR